MATRTSNVFTAFSTMLYNSTTRGTSSHRGTICGISYLRQVNGFTRLQKLQVLVAAAIVVTAVRTRAMAFPLPLALPAELITHLLVCRADGAVDTQVVLVFSLNISFTLRTRLNFTILRCSHASYILLKVLHLLNSQISQSAHFLIRPGLIAFSCSNHQCRAFECKVTLVQLMAAPVCKRIRCDSVTT